MEHEPIFGQVLSAKIDENIDGLFKEKAGPLKRAEVLKLKKPEIQLKKPEIKETKEIDEKFKRKIDTEDEEDGSSLKKRKKSKNKEEYDDLEEEYFARTLKEGKKEEKKAKELDGKDEDEEDEDEEPEKNEENRDKEEEKLEKPEIYTHESLLNDNKDIDQAKLTIFIGNVPMTAITDKKIHKKLKNLVKKYGEISSIRFRSIGFSEILPRKAAFTMKKFHEKRDSANAYVAFKEESAIKKAVEELNGFEFENHHLRVDSLAHPSEQDNKKCIFVGNLDFDESEESLWRHFSSCGDIENVRVVRDSKTNIGKGFAYVQFKDSVFVSKALLLDGKEMKSFNREIKRNLRVTRCKDTKKTRTFGDKSNQKPKVRLTSKEKSSIGKAKSLVGKAGKAQLNNLVEGHRAKPGEIIKGLTGKKKKRITTRSSQWKKKK